MGKGLENCLELAVPKDVIATSFSLLCAAIVFLLLFIKKCDLLNKSIVGVLLAECVFLLFAETVIFRESNELFCYRLVPFESYTIDPNGESVREYWEQALNVLLFIPLGLLAASLFKSARWWVVLLLGLGLSLSVETLQYIYQRGYAEVDDVIHNTIGTAMGCGLYWGLRSIRNALQTKNERVD